MTYLSYQTRPDWTIGRADPPFLDRKQSQFFIGRAVLPLHVPRGGSVRRRRRHLSLRSGRIKTLRRSVDTQYAHTHVCRTQSACAHMHSPASTRLCAYVCTIHTGYRIM